MTRPITVQLWPKNQLCTLSISVDIQTELKASRTANGRLVKQVKSLKSVARIHLPSVVVGAAIGALAFRFLGRFIPRIGKSKGSQEEEEEHGAHEAS